MNGYRQLSLFFCLILTTTLVARADDVDDWVRSQMQLRHIPAISIAVLSNLDRAGLDNMSAGILVRYMPELMPAYLKRWPATEQK